MITDFKLFESQESTLNTLLYKNQQLGKDKLSATELNFLED